MEAVRVFISYAHEDDGLRQKLRAHLSQLKRDGLVADWDDREIPAGAEWADEIDSRLESADVILLLVSADFINSDFCYGKEMTRAIERHRDEKDRAVVIPVILRKSDWQTAPFARFQALPKDGRPVSDPMWKTEDDYFEAVATGLRRRIEQLVPEQTADGQTTIIRHREPKWWERSGVRWSMFAALLIACLAGWWWIHKSSAVDREIAASLTAMHQGRYSDAREALEKLSQDWIGRTRGAWTLEKARLGVSLEPEGRDIPVEQFETGVKKLSREHPNDPDVLLFEGALAARNGDSAAATGKFEQALNVEPGFAEAHYSLGSLSLQQEHFAEALPHLNEAVKLAPNAAHYLDARGYAKRMTGDLKGAEADYRSGAANGSIGSRLDLGELLWCVGNFQDAAAQQEEALNELQKNRSGLKGRNALPWSFKTKADELVTLTELREKVCFARLSLQASQYVLGKIVVPETHDCGANKSAIVRAVVWSLQQAQDTGLREPLASRAGQFEKALLAVIEGEEK